MLKEKTTLDPMFYFRNKGEINAVVSQGPQENLQPRKWKCCGHPQAGAVNSSAHSPFDFPSLRPRARRSWMSQGDKRMKAGASLSQHRVDSGPERVHVNFLWAKPLEEK